MFPKEWILSWIERLRIGLRSVFCLDLECVSVARLDTLTINDWTEWICASWSDYCGGRRDYCPPAGPRSPIMPCSCERLCRTVSRSIRVPGRRASAKNSVEQSEAGAITALSNCSPLWNRFSHGSAGSRACARNLHVQLNCRPSC